MPSMNGNDAARAGFVESARFWLGAVTLTLRGLRRCFFAALGALVIIAFFTIPPQGKELLSLVVEGAAWSGWWWLWLAASAAAVALTAWYTSRVLVSFHDLVDLNLQTPRLVRFASAVETWLPRILGALCVLPLVFFLADAGVDSHVLNSPLLIVAAFALLAAIDAQSGCLRCRVYRWGSLMCLAFVLAAHRWAAELPYGVQFSWPALLAALFKDESMRDGHAIRNVVATTGWQVVIGLVVLLALDYVCVRWRRRHAGKEWPANVRLRTMLALIGVAVVLVAGWLLVFWGLRLPRTAYVVPAVLVVAVAVIAFIVHRRNWFARMASGPAVTTELDRDTVAGEAAPSVARIVRIHVEPVTWMLLAALLAVGLVLFAFVWVDPIGVGHALGAPALLLFAVAIWVAFGAVVLTILPKAYRLPPLGLLLLVVLAVNSIGDAPLTISTIPGTTPARRPTTLADAFTQWQAKHPASASEPVYLVAAAGGGIRAAFLTAAYLAAADDVTDGKFGRHVFVVSGVSGGSLGAATYATASAADAATMCEAGRNLPAAYGPRQRAMLCALHDDFLSPLIATFLYPDLVRAFWVPSYFYRRMTWQDRGRTLEAAWKQSVESVKSGAFSGRFLDRQEAPDVWLVLNSTHVQTGQRVVASAFTWSRLSAVDLFGADLDTTDLSFVGAVHNSGRFTYVSPAGAYYDRKRELAGQLVDGGYFDNSGALSLLEILQQLATTDEMKKRLRVIVITNDGHEDSICKQDPRPVTSEVQLSAPIVTFLATRPARAELSKAALRKALADIAGRDPCNTGGEPSPLIEVSLNDRLVAQFLTDEARDGRTTGECGGTRERSDAVGQSGTPSIKTDKQVSVRVKEAPLGWTLSAATSDWLTRYARREACKLRLQ